MIGRCLGKSVLFVVLGGAVLIGGIQATHAAGDSMNGAQAVQTGDCETVQTEFRELLADADDDAVWAMMAQLYLMNPCFAEDPMKAVRFFETAAERGNDSAAVILYHLYQGKPGLAANKAKALHWLTVAAERGSSEAAYTLGTILSLQGQMVGAVMWGKLAESGGAKSAPQLLQQLRGDASSAEFAEGEARAKRCLASEYADCSID